MTNKKANGITLAICVMLLMSTSGIVLAGSPNEDPVSTNLIMNAIEIKSVSYDHPSVLNVTENITSLGGGTWKYSYEFTNTENSPIWQFMLWTTFDAGNNTQTTFTQIPSWMADGHDVNSISSLYDARNLNPNIKWFSHTWANGLQNSPDAIPVGKFVSGFSYTANEYDTNPKYYGYEVYGSYGLNTGKVTAVGLTSGAAPTTPTISISTDKTVYAPGETIMLKININNPTSNEYSSSVVLKLTLPDGTEKILGGKSFPMAPEFIMEKVIPIKLPTRIAKGTYKFTATLTYDSASVSSSTSFTI